jgi:hypothetical protein
MQDIKNNNDDHAAELQWWSEKLFMYMYKDEFILCMYMMDLPTKSPQDELDSYESLVRDAGY